MHAGAANIIDLYHRHGDVWVARRESNARSRSALIEAGWLERFKALLPSAPWVLDIGCGSGTPLGRDLLDHGCVLTGIDAAPSMIARAKRTLPAGHWLEADMRGLDLGRRFDGQLAWDSFFHLSPDDQRGMFAVFERHAAARAVLMFTTGPARGVSYGVLEGEPLYHASLDPDEYRTLLRDHGFEVVEHIAEDPDCGGHTVWLAQAQR
jgi:SAM-dependent methyltransferase